MKGLTVLMPCLNEEVTLATCINKAFTFLKENNMPGEVLIADNGSTDRSVEIAEGLGARVVHVKVKGYGSALITGIENAAYDYIIMGDADDSYDFLNLKPFIDKLDEGYELVMGNRFAGGIEPGAMSFSHKYIGNPVLSGIGRIFYHTEIRDFHCGQRGFRKDAIMKLGLCTTGMEFASEMVVKAVLFKLKMTEVPIKLYKDGRNRPPHLRSIPDGLRHLRFLLIYSPKWLFLIPGLILFLVGLIFMVLIYIRPIVIGKVGFGMTTMFYAATFMLTGFNAMQFSVLTNIFGKRVGQFPDDSGIMKSSGNFLKKHAIWVGILLTILGIAGIIVTFVMWGKLGFGEVTGDRLMQTAILVGTLFMFGISLLTSGFFANVLTMGIRVDNLYTEEEE